VDLRSYDLNRSNDQVQAQISIGDASQPVTLLSGRGDGAMSALVDALNRRIGGEVKVVSFDEYSLGDNTEANAMACVRVQVGDTVQSAVATAADTTAAALQAILSAVGRVQEGSERQLIVENG
jgi:2-isopropylmalate synthase